MSFDLHVLTSDVPRDPDAVHALVNDQDAWGAPLDDQLVELLTELQRRFAPLDVDDGSPWASWPLEQSVAHGRGCAFNIVYSQAETVGKVIEQLCAARGLVVYDPQHHTVFSP